MHLRQIFLQHVAQTSPAPIGLEITRAEGCILRDADGKEYIDLIGGISVCNIGHRHPDVVNAIKEQADKYLHLLVYGEIIQSPQVMYAKRIADLLPETLSSVYFTNSGAEAVEGAMKLSKRITGRSRIISFENSYHGSTQGALSIMGDEYWRNAFRPLLPGISRYRYNDFNMIGEIGADTACVIAETVQAEQGVNVPDKLWFKALRSRCSETGTLLILDEIQAGFGRTGTLWAFEQMDIVPDILLLGKALGAGMPLGAFVSSLERMQTLISNPVLGHITTFGGHPVSCAAGLAGLNALIDSDLIASAENKAAIFKQHLQHSAIVELRTAGLLIAAEFQNAKFCQEVIAECINNGVLTDWFLFAPHCLRIAPPLTISSSEIIKACGIIRSCCDKIQGSYN